MRTWERAFRRAEVPLSMSEGFHPKPRMMFPSALAVGIAGLDEVMDVDLARTDNAQQLGTDLIPRLPPGLAIHSIEVLPDESKKAQAAGVAFAVTVPTEQHEQVQQKIENLLGQTSFPIQRPGRSQSLDLRPLVNALNLDGDTLRMSLRVDGDGSARPREVLAAIGLVDVESEGLIITRTRVELHA